VSTASAEVLEALEPSARSTMAAQGYLARYTGLTLKTYRVSLTMLFRWLLAYRIDPLDAKRPHLELYMRQHLETERGCSPTSVHHHMSPVRGFYRYAQLDDFIGRDPSIGLALPKVWRDEWRQDWLTARELQAMITAAEQSDRPSDSGLIALLALLGLRIAECLSIQVGDYDDVLLGYRVLRLTGKGGKPATIPLPVAVLRMLEVARGDRTSGALLIRDRSSVHARVGEPLTYRAARLGVDRLAREAGIERQLTPHMFRRGWITAGLDQGISIRDMQIAARHSDPRTTSRSDRGVQNLDGHAVHELTRRLAGRA
jgi:integrase/recombinase XerD